MDAEALRDLVDGEQCIVGHVDVSPQLSASAVRCRPSAFTAVISTHYRRLRTKTPSLRPNVLTCRLMHAIVLPVGASCLPRIKKRRRCANTERRWSLGHPRAATKIGRASCRERVEVW